IRLSSTFLRFAAALKAIARCSGAGDRVVTLGDPGSESLQIEVVLRRSFGQIGHLLISFCEFEHSPFGIFVRDANGTAPRSFGALLPNRPVISPVGMKRRHSHLLSP